MPEMKTQVVKLHLIPKNPKFQVREHGTDAFHVSRMQMVYERHKAAGTTCPIPPPRLFKIGNVYHLTRGFNRLEAMLAAGIEQAEFEVVVGATMSDAAVDASEGNLENTGLPMKKGDVKRAVIMFYDNVKNASLLTDKALAEKYNVHRTTIAGWLNEHDPDRAEQKERVDADGVKHKVTTKGDKKKSEPKAEPKEPEVDLFAEATVSETDTGGDEPATPPSPEIDTPARKDGEYPPDERFMPNAEDSAKISAAFASIKSRMEAVRTEMRNLFPSRGHPVADQMIDFHGQFTADLNALIETLAHNKPDHVCPLCCGTTMRENGDPCDSCNRYGFMNKTGAASLRSMWDRTGSRYADLERKANIAEVEA